MRVLVTGGAGFIGSHLTDAFLARGDEVIVVDDLSTGRAGRLDEHAWLHKLSITDASSLGEIVRGTRPQLICHLAAHIDVRTSVDAPAQDAQVNVVGTVNVLEAARATGARVLFGSSGGTLYGRNAPIPSREDVLPLPESPVGIAKYCAEQYIGLYNRLHGTRHSILRLANVYGPRQDPGGDAGVIPIFCGCVRAGDDLPLYGDGSQTRDYVYVGDAVSAFLAAADAGRPGTWNIGTGVEVSVLDIVAIIGDVAGHPVRTRPGEPRAGELLRSSLAVDRVARDLDWQAQTPLTAGIGTVYRWIEAGAPDRAATASRGRSEHNVSSLTSRRIRPADNPADSNSPVVHTPSSRSLHPSRLTPPADISRADVRYGERFVRFWRTVRGKCAGRAALRARRASPGGRSRSVGWQACPDPMGAATRRCARYG